MENEELDEFQLGASLMACTIKLTRDQGFAIKSKIQDEYPHTFPHYCMKVGISAPNFYSTLNGERPCSLEFLNKLLSGIGYQATIADPEIVIAETPHTEIVTNPEQFIHEDESNEDEDIA